MGRAGAFRSGLGPDAARHHASVATNLGSRRAWVGFPPVPAADGALAYGDSARIAFEAKLKDFPEEAQLHELRGRALALAGVKDEAVREADLSLRLRETKLDAATGPYVRFQVARIFLRAGEYDRALNLIDELLKVNSTDLTPAWLRIDPSFLPLKGNPRFEKLIASQ